METLLGALGAAFVYIAKSWWDERADDRRWKRARERAKEIVESPEGTEDPKEALQQAVIEQQTARIYQEARKVRDSMLPPMNGHRDVPTLDIEVTEDKKRAITMANQVDYQQPADNVGAQNVMVKDSLLGDGVAAIFVEGNPNGVVSGTLGQLAIDRVSTVVYQNADDGTTWLVFGGGGPGSTDQVFTHTCVAADGADFEVMLPAARASVAYAVTGLMGTNTNSVVLMSASPLAVDRFTAHLTAAPADSDTISFVCKDIT